MNEHKIQLFLCYGSCSYSEGKHSHLQCTGYSLRLWLQDPDSFARIAALVCCPEQITDPAAFLQLSTQRKFTEAYNVVGAFERTHELDYEVGNRVRWSVCQALFLDQHAACSVLCSLQLVPCLNICSPQQGMRSNLARESSAGIVRFCWL